ncbi:MAG: hypothetical protein ABI855_02565 [Bacteroidota bacterium]
MDEQKKEESPFTTEIEKAEWREKMYSQFKSELISSPRVLKLKEEYTPSSVDNFIKMYAQEKVQALEWGPVYKKWREDAQLQWIGEAFERLKEIQQKKLFDIHCLWRAGNIQLSEIEICDDFDKWERNIFNCSFIPPVSEDDVELYLQYLQSSNWKNYSAWDYESWQDYEAIKEAYNTENADRNFPDWYDFYNSRRGTGIYMTFPDIKGEREEFYAGLAYSEYRKKHAAELKQQKMEMEKKIEESDKRPHINPYEKDLIEWFVKTFEDKTTQQYMELAGGAYNSEHHDFEWHDDKMILENADIPVPVAAWYDWREAIHNAADNYRRKKIAAALPAAYDEYSMRINMGIAFEDPGKTRKYEKEIKEIRLKRIEAIKRGRVLNGESPDLDY